MPETLLQSPRYAEFIRSRDQALERIRANALIDLSRITDTMLVQIENLTASAALKAEHAFLKHTISAQYEQGTREIMIHIFPAFVRRAVRLRQATFTLAYAGEQEAIGRATKRRAEIERKTFASRIKDEVSARTITEDELPKRVWLTLMRLRSRVIQAFELAVAADLPPAEIVEKVKAAFPKIKVYKRTPRVLSRVREADSDEDTQNWFDFDFIDQSDWDLAVQAYKDTELSPNRFDKASGLAEGEGMATYEWELEREVTEDFVRSVRSGQVAGAEDLGIKEFVWVAVIDNHTCDECCIPRNGKTTGEIDEMDDECGVTVPPAHFNCRCSVGPVASTNEVEGPDWSSFNEWLESEAA